MSLGSIVSKSAPLLGAVISSVSPIGGIMVNLISKLFGVDGKISDADLESRIAADPQAALKLKQLELEHEAELRKLDVEDVQGARKREEEIVHLTGKRDWVVDFISMFLVLGFFGIILLVSFTTADKSDHDILMLLIGQLSAAFLSVTGFYFGNIKK